MITLDRSRGLALLSGGLAADRAAWLLTPDDDPPRRSRYGVVVSLRAGLDATGWAQVTRTPCVVREVTP